MDLREFGEMKCLFPEEYLSLFLRAGVCPDGRSIHGGRKVTLNVGSLGTASGSSVVRYGNTLVTCGVKAELVVATPTSLEQPIVCNIEVPTCSSSSVVARPPSSNTQALSQNLQTVIQKCMDVEQLLIDDGKYHWVLYVDVMCLYDDGNILDSSFLAATAALKTTLVPSVDVTSGMPVVSLKQQTKLLTTKTPLCITFALLPVGRSLLDPTHSEEVLAVGNISFCFHDNSIIQLTHTGDGLSSDAILSLSKVAQNNQAKYLLKLINEAMDSTHK